MAEVHTVIERPKAGVIVKTNCCDAEWSGLKPAHCSVCHRTFTGPWAFDKHRAYGKCRHPEDVDLVLVARWFPCWGRITEAGERDYDESEP